MKISNKICLIVISVAIFSLHGMEFKKVGREGVGYIQLQESAESRELTLKNWGVEQVKVLTATPSAFENMPSQEQYSRLGDISYAVMDMFGVERRFLIGDYRGAKALADAVKEGIAKQVDFFITKNVNS